MDSMEDKLSTILNNPQMMQQIMALAQTMNQASQEPQQVVNKNVGNIPFPDINLITKIGNIARQGSIDKEQQTLLRALNPYLSHKKIAKLERAMQAAKIANAASSLLNSGTMHQISRR